MGYAKEMRLVLIYQKQLKSMEKVYAYYFWLFPNMMFNFYPWGLSFNVVLPQSNNKQQLNFILICYQEKLQAILNLVEFIRQN